MIRQRRLWWQRHWKTEFGSLQEFCRLFELFHLLKVGKLSGPWRERIAFELRYSCRSSSQENNVFKQIFNWKSNLNPFLVNSWVSHKTQQYQRFDSPCWGPTVSFRSSLLSLFNFFSESCMLFQMTSFISLCFRFLLGRHSGHCFFRLGKSPSLH